MIFCYQSFCTFRFVVYSHSGSNAKRRKTDIDAIHYSLEASKKHFNCNYFVYGSYAQRTNIEQSDLNIYFDIGKSCLMQRWTIRSFLEEHKGVQSHQYFLFILFIAKTAHSEGLLPKSLIESRKNMLKMKLKSHSSEWKILPEFTFDKASSKALTAIHLPTNIHCTFSLDSSVPLHASSLIIHLFDSFPICRELIIFVKKWLQSKNLCFSGYFITILVIVFFQRLEILPSIHSLQTKSKKKLSRGCNFLLFFLNKFE